MSSRSGALYGSVEVINLASGATRTWTVQSTPGYWPGIPAWASNATVDLPWWHDAGHGMVPAEITGVRQLDIGVPGGSLAAVPLIAFPAPVPGLESAILAPDASRPASLRSVVTVLGVCPVDHGTGEVAWSGHPTSHPRSGCSSPARDRDSRT